MKNVDYTQNLSVQEAGGLDLDREPGSEMAKEMVEKINVLKNQVRLGVSLTLAKALEIGGGAIRFLFEDAKLPMKCLTSLFACLLTIATSQAQGQSDHVEGGSLCDLEVPLSRYYNYYAKGHTRGVDSAGVRSFGWHAGAERKFSNYEGERLSAEEQKALSSKLDMLLSFILKHYDIPYKKTALFEENLANKIKAYQLYKHGKGVTLAKRGQKSDGIIASGTREELFRDLHSICQSMKDKKSSETLEIDISGDQPSIPDIESELETSKRAEEKARLEAEAAKRNVEKLKNELEEKIKELAALKAKQEAEARQIKGTEGLRSSQDSIIGAQKQEIEKLQKEIEALQEKVSDATGEIGVEAGERARSEAKAKKAEEEIGRLEKDIKEAKKLIAEQDSIIEAQKQRIEEVQKELEASKEKGTVAAEEVSVWEKEKAQLEKEAAKQNAEKEKLEKELEEKIKQLAAQEAEVKRAKEELDSLKGDTERNAKEWEVSKAEADSAIEAQRKRIEELQKELEVSKGEVADTTGEAKDAEERARLEAALRKARLEIDSLMINTGLKDTEIAELKARCDSVQAALTKGQASLDTTDTAIKDTIAALDSIKEEIRNDTLFQKDRLLFLQFLYGFGSLKKGESSYDLEYLEGAIGFQVLPRLYLGASVMREKLYLENKESTGRNLSDVNINWGAILAHDFAGKNGSPFIIGYEIVNGKIIYHSVFIHKEIIIGKHFSIGLGGKWNISNPSVAFGVGMGLL